MGIRLPKTLTLPNPTTPREAALNGELQNFSRNVRDAFVSGVKSGTGVIDDGTNYKITLTFDHGRLTGWTIAASDGVAASTWTDA